MDKRTELAIDLGQTIYNNTIRDLQAKIVEKDKEIAALRSFAQDIEYHRGKSTSWQKNLSIYKALTKNGLIDGNGNPTPLLTGEKTNE